MGLLSASDMAAARALQELTMVDSTEVVRGIRGSDGMGGIGFTWQTVASLKCRMAVNASGDSTLLGGRINEQAPWRVTVPALSDVREADRLVVNGKTLEVVGVSGPSTYETARICVCAEVE